VIVLNETGLRRILKSYFDYYHEDRTHLRLAKDTPAGRPVESRSAFARAFAFRESSVPPLVVSAKDAFAVD
jgi:hypothetical protein